MSEPFLTEIKLVSFHFPPKGWALCNGQFMPINQNQAMFALLGTTYGGDGQNTFQLPDLRGRAAVGQGAGPGLTPQTLGYRAGNENATRTTTHLPAHTHTVPASTQPATHATPAPGLLPAAAQNGGAYASAGTAVPLAGGSVGSSQPFAVRSPYLAMHWCIAVFGIYPSQP